MNLIGNPAVLRRVNRVRILNKLFFNGAQSRAQLARETGLDPKTMTNLCLELHGENYILATPAPQVQGRGRPGELLQLNPDAAFSIGVDIGAYHVTAVLMDFQGHIRESYDHNFDSPVEAELLLHESRNIIQQMLRILGENSQHLLGICLCIPGLICRSEGKVIQAVNIKGFNGLHLVDYFKYFDLPIFLEDSSQMQAVAEKWFGGHYNDHNFIAIDIGYGIGMGIMYNGMLNRGANERSGEIGHTNVVPDGPLCTCGKKGCLETVAGGCALEKTAESLPLKNYGITTRGAKAVYEAAEHGDRQSIDILAQVGAYIGIAIANAVTLFDPGTVILNGGLMRAGAYLLNSMQAAIRQNIIPDTLSTVAVKTSSLTSMAGALGAAITPLQHFFEIDRIEL